MKQKKILAVILARHGSQSLKHKNTKNFCGKPLICHTFDTLKKTKLFDRIILSSDSKHCINLAKKNKIEAPFIRPKKLATSKASALDAIRHCLEYVLQTDKKYDYVQYVMPTTPLKNVDDFKKGLMLIKKKKADMIISVCESSKPKEWFNTFNINHSLKKIKEYAKNSNKNRQKFKKSYLVNGCIYLAKWDVFFQKKNWFKQKTFALLMPNERSVDIDTIEDFKIAERLYKTR